MESEARMYLPWPPSVNRIWRTTSKGIIYLTKAAKEYRQMVCYIVAASRLKDAFPKDSHLEMTMLAYPPDNRHRDIDNICKCVLDALEDASVYNNDSQIRILHLEMLEMRKGGMITVTLNRMDQE